MNLLTPFDLVERFPESQDLAIVGNSGRSPEGRERIGGNSVVARVAAHEPEFRRRGPAGRTDILVAGGEFLGGLRPSPGGEDVAPMVLAITPLAPAERSPTGEMAAPDADVLFTYSPCLIGVPGSTHHVALSTRVAAVQLLCRLLAPKSVFITGFSFAEAPGGEGRWWRRWQPLRSRSVPAAGSADEALLFCRVINQIGVPVAVTPDVSDIFERTATTLGKRVGVVGG